MKGDKLLHFLFKFSKNISICQNGLKLILMQVLLKCKFTTG